MTNNCKELKKAILEECKIQGVVNESQIKYIIATAEWETNHTCRPVVEAYWLSDKWREKHLAPKYGKFWGRGYVQITWESNYAKFSKLLGVDMVKEPDVALIPEYAIKILVIGMRDGLFTGMSLEACMRNENELDFVKARKIVNGTDKADIIASMANDINLV